MRISDWSSDVCSSDLPDRSALDARILWTREFDPAVLSVLAEPGLPGDPDSIDLSALNLPCIAAVAAPQLLHVVLGDGMRRLRLDMCGRATLACPLKPACRLRGLARAVPPALPYPKSVV